MIDLEVIWKTFNTLKAKHNFILLEALGGFGYPITYKFIVANLAVELHLLIS